MKKVLGLTLAALTALTLGLNAQGTGFDELYKSLPSAPAAVPMPAAAPVPAAAQGAAAAPSGEREWLVMVFLNGRNNLWSSGVADVNEMETVGSTDKMAVTVQLGLLKDEGTAQRFLVQKDTLHPVANLVTGDRSIANIISYNGATPVPNADMGSWKHLVDFARWSIRRYPAKKILLVLWNHGSGRIDIGGQDNGSAELGIAYDDLTRNFIRNRQIKTALDEIRSVTGRKVDILDTDACLMQMASVAYELKDSADYVVGAEEIVPGPGLPYDTVLAALAANPGMSSDQASRLLVDKFHEFYDSNNAQLVAMKYLKAGAGTTLSAVRSSASRDFVAVLNTWAAEAAKPANYPALKAAMAGTLAFEYGNSATSADTQTSARSRDLYDFARNINAQAGASPALKTASQDLMDFIESGSYVINNKTTGPNNAYRRAKGMAVYVPKVIYDPSYDETLFARDSKWDELIKFMINQQEKY
ncbi:MAG: clostripain-related cysteine peptidase [Elusimicrobiales bacterium]